METKKHYDAKKVIEDFKRLDNHRKVARKNKISIYLVKKILEKQELNTEEKQMKISKDQQANIIGDVVNVADDFLKDEYGKSSKTMSSIKKLSKYAPLIGTFLKGVGESIQRGQQQKQAQENVIQPIQAPAGWAIGSPLNNLKGKLTRSGEISEWYKQGLAFENQTSVTPANIQYVDPNYREPTRNPIPVPNQNPEPKTLKELSEKYGGDRWDDNIPEVQNNAPGTERTVPLAVPSTDKTTDETTANKVEEISDLERVQQTLQADALKYLDFGVNFINGMEDKVFVKSLKDIEKLIEEFNTVYKPLIPIHFKEVIIQTPTEDLKTIIKERCPDKFKIIEKKKLTGKLLKLFDEIKEGWKE